jgi:hypothetical protein
MNGHKKAQNAHTKPEKWTVAGIFSDLASFAPFCG